MNSKNYLNSVISYDQNYSFFFIQINYYPNIPYTFYYYNFYCYYYYQVLISFLRIQYQSNQIKYFSTTIKFPFFLQKYVLIHFIYLLIKALIYEYLIVIIRVYLYRIVPVFRVTCNCLILIYCLLKLISITMHYFPNLMYKYSSEAIITITKAL